MALLEVTILSTLDALLDYAIREIVPDNNIFFTEFVQIK